MGNLEDPGAGLEEELASGQLFVKVPRRPGLGVELREDIVEKYLVKEEAVDRELPMHLIVRSTFVEPCF